MQYYLVNALQTTGPGGNAGYRPREMHLSAISLRRKGQSLIDQKFLVRLPNTVATEAGEVHIGDDRAANPGPSVRLQLAAQLGFPPGHLNQPRIDLMIRRMLLFPPENDGWPILKARRPKGQKKGRRKYEIVIGGEVILSELAGNPAADYEDDGTGSDEDPLGGDWEQATGGGDVDRVSNQFRASATDTPCTAWIDSSVMSFDDDQEATARPTFSSGYLGPFVRGTNTAGPDGYFGGAVPTNSDHEIWRDDNGSFTQIAAGGASPTSGTDVTCNASGSTLEVYGDGDDVTPQVTTTDTTYTSGRPGVHLFIFGVTTDYLTHFSATDGATGTVYVYKNGHLRRLRM